QQPSNRWTSEGAEGSTEYCGVDFGATRPIHSVALYVLDDGQDVVPPSSVAIEQWDGESWQPIREAVGTHGTIGRRSNWYGFPEIRTSKIRAVFQVRTGTRVGLTELEAWGRATLFVGSAPSPPGNLAKVAHVTASYTSRFDRPEEATDGVINFAPEP